MAPKSEHNYMECEYRYKNEKGIPGKSFYRKTFA